MACFRRCCCCVNLRVGGIMMGIMTLALSVFSIIPMAIFLANRLFMARVVTHLIEEYTVKDDNGNNGNGGNAPTGLDSVTFWGTVTDAISGQSEALLPDEDAKDVQWLAYAMLIFFIISLVLLGIYALFSILLIYGAAKGRRWALLPWIVITLAFLLAYLAGMCLTLWLVGAFVLPILMFFVALIEIAIVFYLWLCVISLYQVLGSADWRNHDDWEMKPRFSTKYNGVPTSED